MSLSQRTVENYLDGFRRADRPLILSCLTDDVEWEIPGVLLSRGKQAFDQHIVDDGFVAKPVITVSRVRESDDVILVEGAVRTQRTDGTFLNLAFCDVFEMRDNKICRLVSYLMEIKGSEPSESQA